MKKYLFTLAVWLCLLSGCGEPQQQPVVEEAKNNNSAETYQVTFGPAFPPFMWRGESGEPIGFEVDLLKAIAAKQDFLLEFTTHPWKGIFDDLEAGQYDIVSASVTITEQRAERMAFSRPYFESHQAVLLSPKISSLTKLEELKGRTITLQEDSSSDEMMKGLLGVDAANFQYQDTTYLGTVSVLKQKSDALVSDSGPILYYAAAHQKEGLHAFVDTSRPAEYYGFAVKKNRPDLVRKLNKGLEQLMADGTYAKIYETWFKHRPNAEFMETLRAVKF